MRRHKFAHCKLVYRSFESTKRWKIAFSLMHMYVAAATLSRYQDLEAEFSNVTRPDPFGSDGGACRFPALNEYSK
jgi:hypothetical protein